MSRSGRAGTTFSLGDCILIGVDRMQRNCEPMRKQVEAWQMRELTDVTWEKQPEDSG